MPAFDTPLATLAAEAGAVLAALQAGDRAAAWRFKWMHPRFRSRHVRDVQADALSSDDARLLVAREQYFDTWADLAGYAEAVSHDGPVRDFERAADAAIAGDLPTLTGLLETRPGLVVARSVRRHHATLLHYLGANGVEDWRQRTPANVLDVARLLLDAGAEVDALADLYDERCTTMSMLVSSSHPAAAGVQLPLALLLVDRGARLRGAGSKWDSAVLTALTFGYLETARGLAARAGAIDSVVELAGLGRLDDLRARLSSASEAEQQAALSLAAQLGHADVVDLLLAHGADPGRYSPEGFHSHATPLHHAVWSGHRPVVERLVDAGAPLDVKDTLYDGTPLDWAVYGRRDELAALLRTRT
jgi:hypothetical protein